MPIRNYYFISFRNFINSWVSSAPALLAAVKKYHGYFSNFRLPEKTFYESMERAKMVCGVLKDWNKRQTEGNHHRFDGWKESVKMSGNAKGRQPIWYPFPRVRDYCQGP